MVNVVAFAGGVGGAKLAHGLYQVLPHNHLSVIGNTADDLTLWGLEVSPDLDTVMYTLAGLANPTTGWGLNEDTWQAMAALERLGVEAWFRLGDQDLATHVRRTQLIRDGLTLTEITARFMTALGVHAQLLPMCDEPVRTIVETPAGTLEFQEYFVRRHHNDLVVGVQLQGIDQAHITLECAKALRAAELVVICPSNPFVSIGPILQVHGIRETLSTTHVPRIAISPIIGGMALKGPAGTMLRDLGYEVSAVGVAKLYKGLIDGMVIDTVDAALEPLLSALGIAVLVCNTVMLSVDDRAHLARDVLSWGMQLGGDTNDR
ncbi:MAG: 2-phospho-L-lactate transferase [Herpetosiphon sp.]